MEIVKCVTNFVYYFQKQVSAVKTVVDEDIVIENAKTWHPNYSK